MNADIPSSRTDQPLPELAVLARLPRVGVQAPSIAPVCLSRDSDGETFRQDEEDSASPLLVVLDDEAQADVAAAPISQSQQAAVAALAEAAKPHPTQSGLPPSPPGPADSSDTLGGVHSIPYAGKVFKLHEWIAPYSSVVVTVAVIAVAGLLFIVASQPHKASQETTTTWAEDTSVAPVWSPGDAAAAENQLAETTHPPTTVPAVASPGPDFKSDDVRDLAPQVPDGLAAADQSVTPTEVPNVVLGSPQPYYPTTNRPAFDQASLPTAETKQ